MKDEAPVVVVDSERTERSVDERVCDPIAFVCILDLITSVGTRTRHAAASPIDADIMCVLARDDESSFFDDDDIRPLISDIIGFIVS
jgi:hypothetical protein